MCMGKTAAGSAVVDGWKDNPHVHGEDVAYAV